MKDNPSETMKRFAEQLISQSDLLRVLARKGVNKLPDMEKTAYG